MADLHPDIIKAIRQVSHSRTGRRFDRYARRKYGIAGWRLAAKQLQGEGGGTVNSPRTSSAGAFGPGQFMPGTRTEMIRRYGVDPYHSNREAVKALELYDLQRGVAGYNPGMPSYTNYVLGQRLSRGTRRALRQGDVGGGPTGGAPGGFIPGRPGSTSVGLQSYTIPGQSFAAERQDARRQFLLSGRTDFQALLDLKAQENQLQDVPAQKVTGDLVVNRNPGRPTRYTGGSGSAPRGRGHFTVAPGANRPGVGLTPEFRRAIRYLSTYTGPLTLTTGTNHSRMTVNGNVSDHWDGHGGDFAMTGSKLIKTGRRALVAFGMSPRRARRVQGGLFNLNWHGHRVQVIFNTQEGGDHTTHLHVGFR